MKYLITLSVALGALLIISGCQKQNKDEVKMLKEKLARFVPTEIRYNQSLLSERQKEVVKRLYRADKIIDDIFLDQVYSRNKEILARLKQSNSEIDHLRLELFKIMFGPFDRLDQNKPFIGNRPKPLGANFYPEDMTKEEFQEWIKTHPQDEKAFTSGVTVIRRKEGGLTAIPYSDYYRDELTEAAQLLREAADYADNPSLKKFLLSRADAFLSNDYYQSDLDWMDLKDHAIEVVIGPYEVYEDELFNYKASFESFITLRDPLESAKLERFGKYLNDIENHLPIPDQYKNLHRGQESPIVVANEIFTAGEAKAGVQTLAFNLPNDERVRQAKGSKKVMLKNVSEAKFKTLLIPIAKIVISESQLPYVTFDAFFNHTLMHEMSHGVGPGFITVNGRQTEVKKELKETYSTIEECKADVLGMFNNIYMIEKGEYPPDFDRHIWTSFLAGIFRSVRFGINEAHGAGNAIIFNYLMEKGAYRYNELAENVWVDYDKIYDAVKQLANELLMLQATGDYDGAKAFIAKYAVMSPVLKKLVAKLSALPVDIKPIYQIEQEMK